MHMHIQFLDWNGEIWTDNAIKEAVSLSLTHA